MSNQQDPVKRGAHAHQAIEITAQMNMGDRRGGTRQWTLLDASHTPAEWQCWELHRDEDDLTIGLDWPEGYGAKKGEERISIRYHWPTGHDGQKVIIRAPYKEPEPITSITVDARKPAHLIATDIYRRLIHKDVERVHGQALEHIERARARASRRSEIVQEIIDRIPGAHTSRNTGPYTVYLGADSPMYTLSVDGDDSIRFEAFSCPVDCAIRIIEQANAAAAAKREQKEALEDSCTCEDPAVCLPHGSGDADCTACGKPYHP